LTTIAQAVQVNRPYQRVATIEMISSWRVARRA